MESSKTLLRALWGSAKEFKKKNTLLSGCKAAELISRIAPSAPAESFQEG